MARIWLAAASIALLAGCSTAGQWIRPEPVEPEDSVALAPFYRQSPTWAACGIFECAALTVPVDYARPAGPTFTLPLIKAAATKPDTRIGVLVAGAGGPGQSGVAMVKDGVEGWPAAVRERFDIVSFDPRGIGGSTPKLDCSTEGEPTTPASADLPLIGPALPSVRQYAEACVKHTDPDVLRHVGTADVVSDLDVLRVVTGQEKLTYLGFSYGTRVGQLYADRFPKKVRAMVLDGVDNVSLDWRDDPIQQAEGGEQALRAYARDCVDRTAKPCPGRNETEILATVDRVIENAKRTGDHSVLGEISGKVLWPSEWPALSELLIDVDRNGPPTAEEQPEEEPEEPAGESDMTDAALTVVNCLDRAHPTDLAAYEDTARRMREASRFADGAELASCAYLPKSEIAPKRVRADGAPPILLVATTVDAATPYRWAQSLAETMPSAVLLTNEDVGHAVYGGTTTCVNDAVDRYLIDLAIPATPARCALPKG